MAVGNKYQLHTLSRSQYDSLPKSSDYLYFVSESDGRINLYKGDVLVSNSFLTVSSLPSSGIPGKLYLNSGDGLVYYHSGSSWVRLSMEVITSGLSGESTNDTVPSSKLVWDTINSFISTAQEAQASAEAARDAAISAKADAETAMGNAESARDAAVSAKVDAEVARGEAQTASVEAEAARDAAVSAKADAESARGDAEASRSDAESARDEAMFAKADAESARGDAQTASAEAKAARDEAVSAKVDAEIARGDAESARSDAWAAKVEAESARDEAVAAKTGIQQAISVIPNTTTACELSEGVYSHIPDSAPTYTLPAVADTGRTHEIVLNVRFGGAALSYSFEDTSGNSVTPLSTPSVKDGAVISFLCRYEPLLEQWAIMPVSLGRREVTA